MTDDELEEIIENLRVLGSDVSDVEAKRSEQKLPKSVRETLSAFANTVGGVIILGLNEKQNFEAVGVSDPAKLSADIASLCSEEMEPPLRPLIGLHSFEDVTLVVVEVPEVSRELKPCFYKGSGINQGSYIRVGDGDRRLTSYEVQVMLSSRGQPRDDEQATPVGLEALDAIAADELVQRLRVTRPFAFKELSKDDVLRRAKVLIRDSEGEDRLSLAGLLSIGQYPQEHFPQLMLTFVHYAREDGSEAGDGVRFIDNVTIEGSIPRMVSDAMIAVQRNMSRRAVISGAGRSDVWEYPRTALREAIVNSLVHRDYSPAAGGTQVQIEMYPNRLVVRNPGGLYGPVSVTDLGEEGICSSRNATLLKLLEDVAIPGERRTVCENRGSGIRAMIASLRAARMSAPTFEDRVSSFRVTFPNHSLLDGETVAWLRSLREEGLSDSQCVGLALLRNGEILDNKSYRTVTGLDSRVATTELGDLVARELVEQAGSRRWARYTLSGRALATQESADDSGPEGDDRARRGDRRPQIMDALGGGRTLSRAEIAELTSLSNATVRRWLTILRREGRIDFAEGEAPQSRHARYRAVNFSPNRQQGEFDLN